MPNLVGFRDASPKLSMEDQAKHDTLLAMQMEALGLRRRDNLTTTDFKENKAAYCPTVYLESQRLVNKSSIGEGEKFKLEGWNNAWTRLHDDGTDAQNLQAVNEGLGQTHRAKLMNDDSVRDYTGEESFQGGGRSGRGGRGGRGGGQAGRAAARGGGGKVKGERRVTFQNGPLVQPITRFRGPKGHPAGQSDIHSHQPTPILKTIPAVRPAKGNSTMPSVPPASIRRPASRYDGVLAAPSVFMASLDIRKERTRDEPDIKFAASAADIPKGEATGNNIGASITPPISTSKEKAVARKPNTADDSPSPRTTTAAADKSIASIDSRPKADLMDLDIGQEASQPVLQFTGPRNEEQLSHRVVKASSFDQQIEALVRSGSLSATQLEALRSIQAQVHAREDVREDATTPVKDASRQEIYTRSELVSLRPKATGIAKKFAEEQDAFLIGEHVHKTRYHTAASLTEDFEKLSISEKKPVKSTTSLPTTEKSKVTTTNLPTTEKSKVNPFGPPPAKRKGPSLPAHLLHQNTVTDHGAAARAQYLGGNENLAPISNGQPPAGDNSTTRPTRRNMINQTGFIALAESRVNSVAAGKGGEDPLLVARKRGL